MKIQNAAGRLTLLVLVAFSLAASGLYPRQQAGEQITELLESRMNQKSRKAAFFIPAKSTLKTTRQASNLPSLDLFLYSDTPALHFYRNEYTRDAVIDFFISLAGSEEVAIPVMYYSDKHNISLLLTFSLMHAESRFLPNAVNENSSSIDRGIFQLNSKAFPHLEEEDFFNPDLNASYGVSHLLWCLSQSSGEEEALAMYNTGYGNVMRGIIPDITRRYIQRIYRYQENLSREFYRYLETQFGDAVPQLSTIILNDGLTGPEYSTSIP